MHQLEFVYFVSYYIRSTAVLCAYHTAIVLELYRGGGIRIWFRDCRSLGVSEYPSRSLPKLPEREALWVVSAAIADFGRKISCGQPPSIDAVLDALAEKGDISDIAAEEKPRSRKRCSRHRSHPFGRDSARRRPTRSVRRSKLARCLAQLSCAARSLQELRDETLKRGEGDPPPWRRYYPSASRSTCRCVISFEIAVLRVCPFPVCT